MNPVMLAALAFGAWWLFFSDPAEPTAEELVAAAYGGGSGESPPELRAAVLSRPGAPGEPLVITLAPGQAPPAVLPAITPGAVRSPRRRG